MMKKTTRYFFKFLFLSLYLHGCLGIFAPPPVDGKPKKSYFSAQNRFLATSGTVIAIPIALALQEAAQKAATETPQNKDKKKYCQALAKNFYKNIAKTELWKRHFLRLYAVIACFSKRASKETYHSWALRTKKALTLYAKENPAHAAVLALWTANLAGTTLHIGYNITRSTTQSIREWLHAFNVNPYKKPKESSALIPVVLNFAQHPESAIQESADTPEAADKTTDSKLQRVRKKMAEIVPTIIPVTTSVGAYFSPENRQHAREEARAWLKTLKASSHGLAYLATEKIHEYEQWEHSKWYTQLATLPAHLMLHHFDPNNDAHVDAFLNIAHKTTLVGTLPADLVIDTVKGAFYASVWPLKKALTGGKWVIDKTIPRFIQDYVTSGAAFDIYGFESEETLETE